MMNTVSAAAPNTTSSTTAESRKRGRPSTPSRAMDLQRNQPSKQQQKPYDDKLAQLQHPATRHKELNELLKITANHDINFSLSNDSVICALVDICFEIFNDTHQEQEERFIVLRSKEAWNRPPVSSAQQWANKCAKLSLHKFSDNEQKVLLAVAVILRNLSYTGANLRLLAYSPSVLHVLTGFLYLQDTSPDGTLHTSALQTLLHLVPYLDLTGQQLLSCKLFFDPNSVHSGGPAVPNAQHFGQTVSGEWGGFGAIWLAKQFDSKEDVVENIPTKLILEYTCDYLVGVWSVFPALKHRIVHWQDHARSVLMLTLQLLSEFIGIARVGLVGTVQEEQDDIRYHDNYTIPGLRAVLVQLPDEVLHTLSTLLFVPRSGPDALDYVDPLTTVVTRITPLKLRMGYDTVVDTDIRDRVLDVLAPLLELDAPRLAARLGQENGTPNVQLYDALVPILTTNVGRNDATLLASQVFRELAQAPENEVGLQFVQAKLVGLAANDPRVSRLVWNDLYPIKAESEHEEEGEEEVVEA